MNRSFLTRNLLLLALVSLFNDFATEMAFPILPYFLQLLGAGAIAVGLMEGTADSIASFLRYTSGRLSDRIGRRKLLTGFGYSLSAVVKIFYAFATHAWQVIGIRGADRVGKGFREAPRDAIIAESVPHAYWGIAFGFHRMLDTTGALLGPLGCLILIHFLGNGLPALRSIFLIATIPGVVAVLLIGLVKETGSFKRSPLDTSAIPRAALTAPVVRFLFVMGFFTVGNVSIAFLVLRATQLHYSLTNIIFLYLCFNAAEAVASVPFGSLTDRIGRAPVLTAAFALFATLNGLVVLFNPSTWFTLLPFFVFVGVGRALREGQGRAFIADLTPKGFRATGFGAYHFTLGFLALPSGYLAGVLWDIDYRFTFLVAQTFCTIALILFLWFWTRGRFAGGKQDAPQDQTGTQVHEATKAL